MSEIEKKPRPRPEWGFFSGTAIGALGLCERRRAGFARLSGWQPVGNWVASAANLSVGVTPTMIRRIATTVCAEKWPEAQAEQVAGVHVFSSQEGAETIPRDGAVFLYDDAQLPPAVTSKSAFACITSRYF
jgi:hypothetical protein